VDPERIADDLVEHLRYATNAGAIRPTMTVLNPQVRVLNEQVIRYGDDPQYAAFGASLRRSGWRPAGGRFEVLPLVLFGAGGVTLHALPDDAVMQVPLEHPRLPWFADLGLRWIAVPAISNMLLRVDAQTVYPVVFNGWYVSDEISSRNLAGPDRYDVLPEVARRLGLDVASDRDGYWRQRALIEVEAAVLWSYRRAGVKISSPQQEANRFIGHLEREEAAGRSVPTDWSWVISPITPVLLPTYHRYYARPESAIGPDLVPDDAFGGFGRLGWDGIEGDS
jgi:nitric-oxide synthase